MSTVRVTKGAPTPEELCALLVALRLTAPGATLPPPRPKAPWLTPRGAADASPVSWSE
ncbi:acyl-CoA carboxylase epsilon subunit [Streptomyces sp. NPDC050504]|uniref:acyl-CoA carboxylase epsilon subunit n=1 Tax=Streptomyces sp. NPDC050504 TaxID=3365618 RepID=UPI00378DEE43